MQGELYIRKKKRDLSGEETTETDYSRTPDKYLVAMKRVLEYNREAHNDMLEEVKLSRLALSQPLQATVMATMVHPHLVRLVGISLGTSEGDSLTLVTQYMPKGCLLDYLKKNQGKISNTCVLMWGKQIAEVRSRAFQ